MKNEDHVRVTTHFSVTPIVNKSIIGILEKGARGGRDYFQQNTGDSE